MRAAYFLMQAVVKGMITAGKGGSIINMSSQMGHDRTVANRTVYCATKHAMEGFTRALAWEVGKEGIRVNTLLRRPSVSRTTDDGGHAGRSRIRAERRVEDRTRSCRRGRGPDWARWFFSPATPRASSRAPRSWSIGGLDGAMKAGFRCVKGLDKPLLRSLNTRHRSAALRRIAPLADGSPRMLGDQFKR